MNTQLNAQEVIAKIQASAELETSETRVYRVHTEGDEIRQGDVYLYPVAEEPSHGDETSERQLAPGTTQGSRHILAGDVTVYGYFGEDVLGGPRIKVNERALLTHPEHADVSLPQGWYTTRYQLDHATRQRVLD